MHTGNWSMRIFRLILTFYRSFFIASFIVTIACMSIISEHGLKALGSLLWIKIITLGLIYLFINNYKRREYYYYQNLGVSKMKLWYSSITIDIIMFIVLMIFTVLAT